MKLFDVLPEKWIKSIKTVDYNALCELRIRVGQPLFARIKTKMHFLGEMGIVLKKEDAIVPTKEQIEDIVFYACEKSIYAYNEQLAKGFVTLSDGVRLGICGQCVEENGKLSCIKDFCAINVRIPHQTIDCSKKISKFFNNPIKSTLVISQPYLGKTTLLRDMVFQLRDKNVNTLIVDERNELSALRNGRTPFDLNGCCDVLTNCNKSVAMENGIRAMSPELIVCDELFKEDMENVRLCVLSGVKIFASTHAKNLFDAQKKLGDLADLFEVFVVLSDKFGVGTIESVFDNKNNRLL